MPTKTAGERPATVIEIPSIRVVRLRVEIVGTTALIVNRFSESAQHGLEAAQQGAAKTKKAARDPQTEYEGSIYRDEDGRPVFPALGIKRSMVAAGQRFADERGTELYGAFSITSEYLPILGGEPSMRVDRVVLSGQSRTTSLAYRASFMPWSMSVPLEINEAFLPPAQALNLLRLAGFGVGIGSWRPEKKGNFGMFTIASVVNEPTGQ